MKQRNNNLVNTSEAEQELIFMDLLNMRPVSEILSHYGINKRELLALTMKHTINGKKVPITPLGPFQKLEKYQDLFAHLSQLETGNTTLNTMLQRKRDTAEHQMNYYRTICETIRSTNLPKFI